MANNIRKLNRDYSKLALVLILAVGIFFRLFWLSKSPPSVNWDEAALGYNAYSLLKTGADEYGHRFPLVLRSFDDYKPALYTYLTILPVFLFGLTAASVRLVSAASGIVVIIFTYLIARRLFDKWTATFSALFVVISPWAVHFSRVAFEANLALALTLSGMYFAIKKDVKPRDLFISVMLTVLSAYTYHANRVLVIPLLAAYFVANRKVVCKQANWLKLAVFTIVVVLPLAGILISGKGLQRLESTSILRVVDVKNNLTPYNLYLLLKNMLGRYLAYFSPANLFVRGSNEPNQQLPGFGIFYAIDFVFWIVGLTAIAINKSKQKLLIYLLFITPVPAIITWNWFLPARVLLLFALFAIVMGFGAKLVVDKIKTVKKAYATIIISIASLFYVNQVANLTTTLFLYLPYAERGNWQYGFEQIMQKVGPVADNYDKVVFETGHAQPHIFVLFYSAYPPEKYHSDIGCPDCVPEPRKNFDFGKYEFRRIYWPEDRSLTNTLFVGSEFSLPESDVENAKGAKIVTDITDDQGEFIARVVETASK